MAARVGKIASLPASLRDEVNQRLHNGQRGPEILAWLNSHSQVLEVLDRHFGEEPVTAQNLSEWRNGGYQDYLQRIQRIDDTKRLAAYCAQLTAAGGSISLPASIAGGQLLAILEEFDPQTIKTLLADEPGTYLELLDKLARLQKSDSDRRVADQNEQRLAQNERKLAQAERALQLQEAKFQRQTAELFLKWRADQRALEIADSSHSSEVKMKDLVQLMFGAGPTQPSS